ncbi:MAG: hypothetical protein BWX47_02007 [candidate division Hyd24-12 bacterium ADurb.Bin004]|nr:MAG: hypothetical protein BWX47_02007 [candidate division Hyd24-12 bacterium ADurb.Bin004]
MSRSLACSTSGFASRAFERRRRSHTAFLKKSAARLLVRLCLRAERNLPARFRVPPSESSPPVTLAAIADL